MSDTPTPRTDAAQEKCAELRHLWNVAQSRAEQLEHQLEIANERIRRLEEAGDAFVGADSVEQYVWAEDNWIKTKQAKP